MSVSLPDIFFDEKYAKWIDWNTDKPVALKNGAPQELVEAYTELLQAMEEDYQVE